jgi:nicotinate-nucleotide adenylyltransferase
MKLGIYGGSFSPPHAGHFKSALHFYDHCRLDKLLIMPAGIPPHKDARHMASPEMRLSMLRLCFAPEKIGGRQIEICDFELKNSGKSYTYLTLEHFASEENELYLLVGSDMFLTLDRWNRPETIFRLATIVLNPREACPPSEEFEKKKALYEKSYGARILFSDYAPVEISSSALRGLLEEGKKEAQKDLDSDVYAFLLENKLYGSAATIEALKKDLEGSLSKKRLEHVLSVEKEVCRMATLFSLDKAQTLDLRRAALLHDLTHEKSFEEQKALFALYGYPFTKEDENSPAVLHQTTGALVAADKYGVSPECAAAIACHTTGKEEMTLLEKLLCLADFIEETREYPACVGLRDYFYSIFPATPEKARIHLDACMVIYFESTVKHLEEKGAYIHPQTLAAWNFLKNKTGKSCKEEETVLY